MGARATTPSRRRPNRVSLLDRNKLRAILLEMPGLFTLLMKPRNGTRWTEDEQMLLRARLHSLSHMSVYFVVLALPGTAILLPLLAWWLDRRRGQRSPRETNDH